MRNAVGSAWVFGICLAFILLFTAYLAISVNYAKAFKIKDHIIDLVEEHEGYTTGLDDRIYAYLNNEGYNAYGTCQPYVRDNEKEQDWALETCLNYGDTPVDKCSVCLYRDVANKQNKQVAAGVKRSYYRVVTFFKFDLPVVKAYLPAFQVAGESRYFNDFANKGK